MGSSLSISLGKKKTNEGDDLILTLPEISEELVVEILMRLPVKSLMRFKCVSKHWLSLISSRYLANRFLKSCASRQRSFAYFVGDKDNYTLVASSARDHSDTSVSLINKVLELPGMRGEFVSAVRGLACFTFKKRVRICNITTRQVVELPRLTSSKAEDKVHEMHYFGHDPVHDEYKVLSVVFDNSNKSSEHHVLVLGAGASWRKIQCHIPHDPHGQGITINGVLYYVASSGGSNILMSFDLNSEELKLIEVPNMVRTVVLYMTIVMNYKGKIALLEVFNNDIVNVWVLEDVEKSQWSDKKTFALPISQLNAVHGENLRVGASRSDLFAKVWLAKVGTSILPPPAQFFTYDLERNEIAPWINMRIRKLDILLGVIRGSPFFVSGKATWKLSTVWDDSERASCIWKSKSSKVFVFLDIPN